MFILWGHENSFTLSCVAVILKHLMYMDELKWFVWSIDVFDHSSYGKIQHSVSVPYVSVPAQTFREDTKNSFLRVCHLVNLTFKTLAVV